MATKQLNLPGNLPDVNLNKNQDKLSITFDNACTWCYSDPSFAFGNPLYCLRQGTTLKQPRQLRLTIFNR
jgi:hypothetical protein